MKAEWISIQDAVRLTEKSDSTIRNLVRDFASNPVSKNVVKKGKKGNRSIYLINKDFLIKKYNLTIGIDSKIAGKVREIDSNFASETNSKVVEILREQLAQKDMELERRARETERRDRQIDGLLERIRELNILTKGMQDRILLLEERTGGNKENFDIREPHQHEEPVREEMRTERPAAESILNTFTKPLSDFLGKWWKR